MPRLVHSTPTYRLHRPSGRAVVTIQGKDHYLGRYGTKSSKEEYDRVITEWLSAGRPDRQLPPATELTIAELIVAYWRFAERHYVKRGQPTAEQHCMRAAFRPLRRLYGHTPAVNFGPVALKAVREDMLKPRARRGKGDTKVVMCRSTINSHVRRIRRMFRWAAAEEILPVTVYQALATLPGLQRGRCKAREPEPIGPVSDSVVDAAVEHLPQVVADMVRFQRLTGCRPEEVCGIRPCDVDSRGDVWRYVPEHHKTEHRGRHRIILIGPKAQQVLRTYLLRDHQSNCFVPAESEKRRNELRREHRQSPMTPSQSARRPRRHRRRSPGTCYSPASYRRAIHRACAAAGIEQWSPNRLRHSAATDIRSQFGLEAAQVILGHSRADVTQVYAERDIAKAVSVVREVG